MIAETSGFPGLADHPVKPLGELWVSDNFNKQGEKKEKNITIHFGPPRAHAHMYTNTHAHAYAHTQRNACNTVKL